jgi:hypothetical protein
MEYIFDKSILRELSDNGCSKKVINRLDKSWRIRCKELENEGVKENQKYVINKLKMTRSIIPDKPPLFRYTDEGKNAETAILEEIAFRGTIGTNLIDQKYSDKYISFKETRQNSADIRIDNSNLDKMRDKDINFNNAHFNVDFSDRKVTNITKFKELFDPTKYNYIYQFKFYVENDFYMPIINNIDIADKLSSYNINFSNYIPDLIKVVAPEKCTSHVFNEKFEIVPASPNKIKLQVCDIKMSEFENKFFIELGLYMLALNSFIYNYRGQDGSKLSDYFEVISEGVILPKKNNESDKERWERIEDADYELEQWNCPYETVKEKILQIFNVEILKIIESIENGDRDIYDNFRVSSKCQTCDYYGGQYSELLRKYLEKYNSVNSTNYTIDEFYNDLENNYCRYKIINTDNLNKLSCLKNGSKSILTANGIDTLTKLDNEINTYPSKVFDNNITLKADKQIISSNIKLRNNAGVFEYIANSSTLNLPKWSDLKIYIDEKHDSQGRSLAFSFIYSFKGKDKLGKDISEDNFKSPYVAIIDDSEFTLAREKREFIDYLIKLNEILDKYEEYTSSFSQVPRFSFIYWGNKTIQHIKDLFISVFPILKSSGGIESLYSNLNAIQIGEKKKDILKLLYRFNSFFTSDNELEDYRIVQKNPFYNLKSAVEDIMCLNINIANTLYEVNNKLRGENKKAIYHKPDSDEFTGYVFSKIWQKWSNTVEKRKFISSIDSVLKDRLFCILNISSKLDRTYLKGESPNIPKLEKIYMFPKLAFGLDLFLLHKLDEAYSLIDKENVHALETYRKGVLGKAIVLDYEEQANKKAILDNHFGIEPYNIDEFMTFHVNADSIDANYDQKSFGLTIYPIDKKEYIYYKFSSQSRMNCIYYDKTQDLQGINLVRNDPETKTLITLNYRQVVNVKIVKFDRDNKLLIIQLNQSTRQVMDFLTNAYNFDFTKDVTIENVYIDTWGSKLKKHLNAIEKDNHAQEILEKYNPIPVNSYTNIDVENALKSYYGTMNIPLDSSQVNAIVNTLNHKLTLLWGPPGTGKSYTIGNLLRFYYMNINDREMKRVLIMGNYDATDNILETCIKLLDENDVSIVRIKSNGRECGNFSTSKMLSYEEFEVDKKKVEYTELKENVLKKKNKLQIFTCTPDQMLNVFISRIRSFKFDLVIVDEASQMDVGHFTGGLLKIADSCQFLLAGDNLQLAPISNVKLKETVQHIYGSIFDYYNNTFAGQYPSIRSELKYNRRSNKVIVEFSKEAFGYPKDYIADVSNEDGKISFKDNLDLNNFYEKVICPEQPITVLNYSDGNSSKLNLFEAEQVVKIVKKIWNRKLYKFEKNNEVYDLFSFFDKGIGIVVPHRAQRTKIQNMLIEFFISLSEVQLLSQQEKQLLKDKIIACVDTVEKYQGQQREIMICSFVLGDTEIIEQEEEFIYNPNRLNVMISRARFKAIILISNELVSNVSNNIDIIDIQKALKYLMSYCDKHEEISEIGWKNGLLRYKTF